MDRLFTLPKNIPLFQSLGHHNYRLLWQGNLLTQSGQWMQQLAMGWLVLELGYQMAGRVQALLGDAWADVEVTNDLAGIPRVLAARKK